MNVDMFAQMLLGKDLAEAYVKSPEGQEKINILANIQTIYNILLKNCITTSEYYEETFDYYQKEIEKEFIETYKKKLKEIQEQ